jgi:hypothetical protein
MGINKEQMLIDALQQTKNKTTINVNLTEYLCQMHKLIINTAGLTGYKVLSGFSISSFNKQSILQKLNRWK